MLNGDKTSVTPFRSKFDAVARDLLPGYFALVMATGIVSIALHIYNFLVFSDFLFYFNVLAFAGLWVISGYRIVFHSDRYLSDIRDHARGPGFFTVIAGTNTLASDFLIVGHNEPIAFILWILGFALWAIFQYGVFTALMLSDHKPTLDKAINGTWLVAVVSTQSLSVVAAQLTVYHSWMFLISIIMYFIGWFTYIMIMSLVNYRLLFFELKAESITGPYWINMGATAITTLAGALILLAAKTPAIISQFPINESIMPFIVGATFLIWAYGSWWIPWLLIIGIWKHTIGKVSPWRYDAQFWGAVFPMGMYTVSTYMFVRATNLGQLLIIPNFFIYFAIAGWIYEFVEFLYAMISGILKPDKNGLKKRDFIEQ
ncbi:C4-dicarboxylate transporter/malic acid transport protein [Thermoplasmatales archaeon]|nr:C4-dicarboxylate transporter/malic acid transport protein [Thermoplasmatales archaeon]